MERRDEVIYIPSVLVYVSISWPDGRALNTVNGTTTRLREIWMPHTCSVEILCLAQPYISLCIMALMLSVDALVSVSCLKRLFEILHT